MEETAAASLEVEEKPTLLENNSPTDNSVLEAAAASLEVEEKPTLLENNSPIDNSVLEETAAASLEVKEKPTLLENNAPIDNSVFEAAAASLEVEETPPLSENVETTTSPIDNPVFEAAAASLEVEETPTLLENNAPVDNSVFEAAAASLEVEETPPLSENVETTTSPIDNSVFEAAAASLEVEETPTLLESLAATTVPIDNSVFEAAAASLEVEETISPVEVVPLSPLPSPWDDEEANTDVFSESVSDSLSVNSQPSQNSTEIKKNLKDKVTSRREFSGADIPQLIGDQYDSNSDIRTQLASSLGKVGVSGSTSKEVNQAIVTLGKLCQDPDQKVRQAAVEALGNIKSVKVIPLLKLGLRDTDADVVKSASAAMDKFKGYRLKKKQKKSQTIKKYRPKNK